MGSGEGSRSAGEGVPALCPGVWAVTSGYDSRRGSWAPMYEACLNCGKHRPPGSKLKCNGEG